MRDLEGFVKAVFGFGKIFLSGGLFSAEPAVAAVEFDGDILVAAAAREEVGFLVWLVETDIAFDGAAGVSRVLNWVQVGELVRKWRIIDR